MLTANKINVDGYNLSFIEHPNKRSKYLATIRVKEKISDDEYPTVRNKTFLLILNDKFEVDSMKEMIEKTDPPRKRFTSYTTGLEDCRLISDTLMTGVLLDNNENWIPEMCLCHFDLHTGNINKIITLRDGEDTPQKNWLALSNNTTSIHFLHSYSPLKVVSVEKEEGMKHTIHFQKIFNLEGCEMHGGACVHINQSNQFLVSVRVVQYHRYQFSLWLLFSDKYKVIGTSAPFKFFEKNDNDNHYEMCMSLVKKENLIYASISVCDKDVYIVKYDLNEILKEISMKDTIDN